MQPLAVVCTTCKARLRVRDQRLLGQILPCPRCGGMVLVKSDQGDIDGADGAERPVAPPRNVNGPRSTVARHADSFDHIDQLLDGPLAARPSRPEAAGERWRTSVDEPIKSPPREIQPRRVAAEDAAAPRESTGEQPPRGREPVVAQAVPAAEVDGNSTAARDLRGAKRATLNSSEVAASFLPPGSPDSNVDTSTHENDEGAGEADAENEQQGPELVGAGRAGLWMGAAGVGLVGLVAGGIWYQTAAGLRSSADANGQPVEVNTPGTASQGSAQEDARDRTIAPGADTSEHRPEETAPPTASEPVAAAVAAADLEQAAPQEPASVIDQDQAPATATNPVPPGDASVTSDEASESVAESSGETANDDAGDPMKGSPEVRTDGAPGTVAQEVPDPAGDELSALANWLRQPATSAPASAATETLAIPANPPQTPRESATRPTSPTTVASPVVASRPIPPAVDVASRLRSVVAGYRYDGTPLLHVLRDIGDLSGIPISLDPTALVRTGVDCRTPVTLRGKDQRVEAILDVVLEKAGLGYVVEQGQLWVVGRQDMLEQAPTRLHDIRELVEGDRKQAAALADWIKQLVDYGSWQGQVKDGVEGQGQIELVDGSLQVTQSGLVHTQVEGFLRRLREARGTASDGLAESGGFECPSLDRRVTVRSTRGGNLHRILASLEEQTGATILVDWAAAYETGWVPSDEWRLFCVDTTLREALDRLFASTGLTFRVVGPNLVQVVSLEMLQRTHELRFYQLRSEGTRDVQELCRSLAQELGRDKFQPQGPGAFAYDPKSRHLIVSLPQPLQAVVSERLSERVAPAADDEKEKKRD